MRDILFKAKRLDNGKWIEGNLLLYDNGTAQIHHQVEWYAYDVDPNTISQFTGLTDKNGNKIWENDIVNFEEEMYMVDWSEIDACFEIFDTGLIERFTTIRSEDCEIIGNKFDNPELLEVLS